MSDNGYAIRCPHCGQWDINTKDHPSTVAITSLDEFNQLWATFSAGHTNDSLQKKLLHCKRPRCYCPASYEGFIFVNEKDALDALKSVKNNWAISRDFRLYKVDRPNRWDKGEKYYCILFCTKPVPRQQHIELDRLINPDFLSRVITGLSHEIGSPITLYISNVSGDKGTTRWMPLEAYSSDNDFVPPRYNRFCSSAREITMRILMDAFEKKMSSPDNCTYYDRKNKTCFERTPACLQKSGKWWNKCPAFLDEREKKCPCYKSDLNLIAMVDRAWREGKKYAMKHCYAGFTELAIPVVVHNHLVGVAMTGQFFKKRSEVLPANKIVTQEFRWEDKNSSVLKGHEDTLETVRHVLFWEEERKQPEDRVYFLDDNALKIRLNRLRESVSNIEDIANARYRDIRISSENAFRQELMGRIQRAKMMPDFFKEPLQSLLLRMRDFWAFKQVGLLLHHVNTSKVYLTAYTPWGKAKDNNFSFPGQELDEVHCLYDQTHPLSYLYDPLDPESPGNTWMEAFMPILHKLAKDGYVPQLEKECLFVVAVPFGDYVYAVVFVSRDAQKVSITEGLNRGGVSELCQEFMLRTCTEVVYELVDVGFRQALLANENIDRRASGMFGLPEIE
jgi:ligand-binding sensor protein